MISKDKSYLNYFMLPQYIPTIGNIYPVKLNEYDEFTSLVNKFLVLGLEERKKEHRQSWELKKRNRIIDRGVKFVPLEYETLFDYLLDIISQQQNSYEIISLFKNSSQEEQAQLEEAYPGVSEFSNIDISTAEYMVTELCRMIEITTKNKTEYNYSLKCFDIYGVDDLGEEVIVGLINKYNFDDYRNIVMEQNMIFTPPISDSLQGQKIIQRAIEKLNKKSKSSTESIISTVSCSKNVTDEELMNYTYYRLSYDFNTINRINTNLIHGMFASQGAKVPIEPLSDIVDMNRNPYDNIFNDHDEDNETILK